MTHAERIDNLKAFGYTERESEFLSRAALISGYFVRRQFLFFIGRDRGQIAASFLSKALHNGHVRTTSFRGDRLLYHISSKVIFEALGEADNRNRRRHEVFAIKARLMALDFLLQHPGYQFLSTETDKTLFFRHLNVASNCFPARQFRSVDGRSTTVRYFVDKFPIFTIQGDTTEAVGPHFCYIDEGQHCTSRFERYLNDYGRLFAGLDRFTVVYIASSAQHFGSASRLFQRLVDSGRDGLDESEISRLHVYFGDREAYERGDLQRFDQQRLIRFREDRKRFSGATYEALFTHWRSDGRLGSLPVLQAASESVAPQRAEFKTYLLRFNYALFGTLVSGANRGGT